MKRKLTGYPSIDKVHLKGTKLHERRPIIPGLSLSNVIDLINMFNEAAPAVDCLGLQVTHGELKRDGVILSRAFAELGVRAVDVIAVACPNLYQSIACFKAANRMGAVTTFLNELAPIEEIIKYINLYKAPLLINFDKDSAYNQRILSETGVKHVVTLQGDRVNDRDFDAASDSASGRQLSYHALGIVAQRYRKALKTVYGGKRDALILYTSGSTGEPKELLFTNENVLAACIYYKHSARLPKVNDGNRRWMGVVPFMYPYGFIASVLATFLCGRQAIVCPDIGAHNVAYYYEKGPNIVYGSPAFLELTKRNVPPQQDLSSVQMFVSGGDFLSVSQSKDGISFFKEHGADIRMCNCSGNGEACGCVTNAMNIKYRPETVGKLAIGPDFIVLNPETHKEVKYGEPGMLCVSGKHVFKGYYNNKELTAESLLRFGGKSYYITGNYGVVDGEGYFTMLGRASRFYIISSLNKVYCERVQRLLSNVSCVDSCAVVPKPDGKMLFVGKAYVVLKSGVKACEQTAAQILSDCGKPMIIGEARAPDLLQPYEVPASVEFLDELPRTAADNVDYQLLQEWAASEN